MTQILDVLVAVAPAAGVAYAAVRWGREQRPGFADDRRERDGARWTVRYLPARAADGGDR
jgi:hypothetical protein